MLAEHRAGLAAGDNTLLKTIVGLIEKSGSKVVGAHQIVPDLAGRRGRDDQG